MQTLTLDPDRPDESLVRIAADRIAAGGIVAFPTETFYGLGVDPWNEGAVAKLVAVKGREDGSPILLLLGSLEQAVRAAASWPPSFESLARVFWPGPLTLVVPARAELPAAVTGGTATIGLRVPGSRLARTIPTVLGRPVTGTSANRSGAPPARTAQDVRDRLEEAGLDLLMDGGRAPGGAPSTVVDLTGESPRLLRAGAIPYERVLGALMI